MKSALSLMLALALATPAIRGQDQYVWLRLTDNRVVTNARFSTVVQESLRIVRGGLLMSLDLAEVMQIRFMGESSFLRDAAIGAGAGLAAGACVTWAFGSSGGEGNSTTATMIACTVIGGMIGGTVSALHREGEIIDLGGMTRSVKADRIREAARSSIRGQ